MSVFVITFVSFLFFVLAVVTIVVLEVVFRASRSLLPTLTLTTYLNFSDPPPRNANSPLDCQSHSHARRALDLHHHTSGPYPSPSRIHGPFCVDPRDAGPAIWRSYEIKRESRRVRCVVGLQLRCPGRRRGWWQGRGQVIWIIIETFLLDNMRAVFSANLYRASAVLLHYSLFLTTLASETGVSDATFSRRGTFIRA